VTTYSTTVVGSGVIDGPVVELPAQTRTGLQWV
jgi:hypothetical protein